MNNKTLPFAVFALTPAAFALGASLALAAELPKPSLAPANVDAVFVPVGFDDNDNIEVVVSGHLTNICSKTGPLEADVNADARTITLRPQVWSYQSPSCATQEMFIPFTQAVSLGTIDAGEYKVVVNDAPAVPARELVVAPAFVSTPDDFVYAPVESASVTRDKATGRVNGVRVSGTYPTMQGACWVLKEVRATAVKGNVIVVLPISELRKGAACDNANRTFKATKKVSGVPAGDLLVHVRVMNGQSLNKVVLEQR